MRLLRYQSRPQLLLLTNPPAGVPIRYLWWNSEPPTDGTQNTDAIGVYLKSLFDIGVAAAASAGNWADIPDRALFAKLAAQSPRRNGGTNSPLVVVGNADQTGNRYAASNWVDENNEGILTVYAPGTDILCAVKDNTNAWNVEPAGTSQATAATAGLMAYFLSDPALQAQFTAGGAQNMPMRLKQHLIQVSTTQKGIGGWGDANTDGVPRLSNGENVECGGADVAVVQGAPPVPAFVAPPQTATGKSLARSVVSEGMSVVLPASLRVSLVLVAVVFRGRVLTLMNSLRVTTARNEGALVSLRQCYGPDPPLGRPGSWRIGTSASLNLSQPKCQANLDSERFLLREWAGAAGVLPCAGGVLGVCRPVLGCDALCWEVA